MRSLSGEGRGGGGGGRGQEEDEEEEEEEVVGGDSLAMATNVEKYSHSCASGGGGNKPADNAFWRAEETIQEERHTNQSRQTETQTNRQTNKHRRAEGHAVPQMGSGDGWEGAGSGGRCHSLLLSGKVGFLMAEFLSLSFFTLCSNSWFLLHWLTTE